ncbi:MAG: insulinase family protein [Bacteroidia bacterium]|nr:insulinase family protein [Bacteroidia bacterium]MDW8236310.1 pitrilysin family protein [Bacteroidia bacterium]
MNSFTLPNGLTVYLLPSDSPFTAVMLGYRVGAAHEKPSEAGMAHLLEHLLFEDDRIAYDSRLQAVGGSTNAYTGQDYTVYYARVPREAAMLALELEAERLFRLSISDEKVRIQQQVVAEEFRQRYLNPPYADRLFHLSRAAFPDHPYQRMVIGETPEQILDFTPEQVRAFYAAYYAPQYSVLCVAGGIEPDTETTIAKLYGESRTSKPLPSIPSVEELPSPTPFISIEAEVPQTAVFWAFRIPPLEHEDIPAIDLLDDYIGDETIGYLNRKIVQEKALASRISSYVWQLHAGGLWLIEAYLTAGVSPEQYEAELQRALEALIHERLEDALRLYRPQKYLSLHRERERVLDKARASVHAHLAGHPEWYEDPITPYEKVSLSDLQRVAQTYFSSERRVRLHYIPKSVGATG